MDNKISTNASNAPNPNAQNLNVSPNEEWNLRRMETKSGILFSKWHASRLRILQEKDDYAAFIKFIEWRGGNPPNEYEYDEENDFLSDLKDEFRSWGGYEFFEKHELDLPPCGVSIDTTYFD